MKRYLIFLVCLIMSVCFTAHADTIDLSGMTYDELIELIDEAQRQIMFSDYWQEVEVPQGEYLVGVDIPEGKWIVTACPQAISYVSQRRLTLYRFGIELQNEGFYDYIVNTQLTGVETPQYQNYDWNFVRVDLASGDLFVVETGSVIFTPDKGLGFKFN